MSLLVIQIITIVVMLLSTYFLYQLLGGRRQTLLFTKKEKEEWDNTAGRKLGGWFTLTNIVGTLTSIGTTYVFFIGSSKLFGYWTFVCAVTIWAGAFLTTAWTRRIIEKTYVKSLMQTKDQVAGVLASLFWRPNDSHSHTVARLVKYVSMANLAALIWLDFSLFSDISVKILGFSSLWIGVLLVFATVFIIFDFTVTYGLRGFVFADLFQSPAIILASIIILVGCIWAGMQTKGLDWKVLSTPVVPLATIVLFVIHVSFLNLIQVVVTEPHWLRVWLFPEKTIKLQKQSLGTTAILWSILIITGFFVSLLSNGAIGEAGIATALKLLTEYSPVFAVAFWVAGVGALFASADVLIYSFLLVNQFNPDTGTFNPRLMRDLKPTLFALIAAIGFTVIYLVVKLLNLPFEKILFSLVPFCLNLFPAFLLLVLDKPVKTRYIYLSILGYFICVVIGFFTPEQELAWTLAASFVPVGIAVIASLIEKRSVVSEPATDVPT